MDWQPIETAPEGRELLLYFPVTKNSKGRLTLPEMICTDRMPVGYPRKPTHWMPLPEPPKPASPYP
jgi:hypothetical protein